MSCTVDKNWMSYVGDNPDVSGFVNPLDPQNYSDIMKFGNCTNTYVENKTVSAGSENCVDAVRGSDYVWSNCVLVGGAGIATVTIKGAIDGFTFRDCKINHGNQTDLELGQFDKYWHPGRKPTKGGLIERCSSYDNKPIRITCWNANKPEIIDTNVNITVVPWVIWFPYFCFRYVWIRIFP